MNKEIVKCENCKAFHSLSKEDFGGIEYITGECRLKAPVVLIKNALITVFPVTASQSWCLEFTNKENRPC
jgi:hypothetical protein